MGFFILVIVAIVIFSTMSGKASGDQWKNAADLLHLRYEPGMMGGVGSIHGTRNGNNVAVTVFTRGSGNSSRSYTRYRMDYRNMIPLEMKIVRQGVFQEVGKAFGMLQDIEVGNPEFDNHLLVKGADAQRVRAVLTTQVQAAIIDLLFSFNDITVTGSHIEVVKSGKERDSSVIIKTLRRLEVFCETIMEADEKSSAPYEIDMENEVESDVKPPEVPYIPSITMDPLSIPNPEVVTEGPPDFIEIEEPPELSEEDIPPIPVPPEHQRFDSEPTEIEEETVGELETAPQPDIAAPVATDLQEIARQLFVDPENAMLTSTQFDERFKGIAVSGTVKMGHVARFSYDPVFSGTKGVKASCDVCTLDGSYSKIRVIAEVMYPEDQYEQLSSLQEQTISINGTLVAYNSIMHRLYVAAQ
ncbi:MAG: hypothetical protein JXR40_12425 [Pontiellaceae bacterium]|nr:hypothetical protein [Pontiellaceae bacterium]